MTTTDANALTARWSSTLDDGGTVLSGPGVYILLALLAPFATGRARAELLAAAPAPLSWTDSPTTRMASAVWSRADVPLTAEFTAAVPPSQRGPLTGDPAIDQPVLDAWAAGQTDGEIPALPIRVDAATRMVLASALSVRTTWERPFTDGLQRPDDGPWAQRSLAGLHRRERGEEALRALRVVGTAAGALTLLTVAGREDVDVVLALGDPGAPPSAVLPAAITAGRGDGLALEDGPGVTVVEVDAADDRPELVVDTVRFRVAASHDLLARAGVFGLGAASDAASGHFPGISPVPMVVSQARQNAVAEFTAEGFKAAAVTAFGLRAAGAYFPQRTFRKRVVSVVFGRPFGFLAVHRATRLVLVAGWVGEPEAYNRG